MKITNNISKQISDKRLNEIVNWVHRETGKPTVNNIFFGNNTDNYTWKGLSYIAARNIVIDIGEKLLAMRYKRDVKDGKVVIDPCGLEETLVVAIAHEMMHLHLGGEFHRKVHQGVYDILKEWRQIHPSSKVKRFILLGVTFFLAKLG